MNGAGRSSTNITFLIVSGKLTPPHPLLPLPNTHTHTILLLSDMSKISLADHSRNVPESVTQSPYAKNHNRPSFDTTATSFEPPSSTLPASVPHSYLLEQSDDVLNLSMLPDPTSVPLTAWVTGGDNADQEHAPTDPTSGTLAESVAPPSNFHGLLSAFLVAAAAASQDSPIEDHLTSTCSNNTPVALLDAFDVDIQNAFNQLQSETQAAPQDVSDFSMSNAPQEWFAMPMSSGTNAMSEPDDTAHEDEHLPLFEEGWDTTSFEDLVGSWIMCDQAASQDDPTIRKDEANADEDNQPSPALAPPRTRFRQVESIENLRTASSCSSAYGESNDGYQRLVSCAAEVEPGEEEHLVPLLSHAEPIACQTADQAVEETCDTSGWESIMFDLVTERLHCLQAGYEHDNVIESCQATLQRFLMDSRCNSSGM
ncbi:hypothetical protein BDY19DRAFT_923682 [Irpex rosettiformis]|uniref:Uncharacterized protein n=1 Tax=Irpex rosettiformis TaxID=378272 RepID=A0ACB8UGM7_9APHY|nr:hypothetical protein BDY19DRAFT_923682 [Irpex rosettiformis]